MQKHSKSSPSTHKHAQARTSTPKHLLGPYRNFLNFKKQEFFDFHEMSDREEEEERRRKQSLDSPQTIEANKNYIQVHIGFEFQA